LIPDVSDYVQVEASMNGSGSDDGKVCSRLFRYIKTSENETYCHVNVVVERDPDPPWDLLIRE
jgi:hypothetical protein